MAEAGRSSRRVLSRRHCYPSCDRPEHALSISGMAVGRLVSSIDGSVSGLGYGKTEAPRLHGCCPSLGGGLSVELGLPACNTWVTSAHSLFCVPGSRAMPSAGWRSHATMRRSEPSFMRRSRDRAMCSSHFAVRALTLQDVVRHLTR